MASSESCRKYSSDPESSSDPYYYPKHDPDYNPEFKRPRLGSYGENVSEPVEDQEPISEPARNEYELEPPLVPAPACFEHEKTELGSSDEIGKSKAETKESDPDKDFVVGPPSLNPFGSNARLAAARGFEQVEIQVPKEKVDLITGRGGENIRNMLTRTRALIELTPNPSEQSEDWIVRITGYTKQTMFAREMIKDILNQTLRQSPLSSGYIRQQANRLYELLAPHQRYHHSQFSGYKYPQRAPYPSPNSQNPPSSNGNYHPPVSPRSHAPEEAPAPSGPMQQTFPNPPYGSAPASAGYGQTYPNNPPAAASSGYGQPVAGSDQQPGVQQQPQPAVFAEQQQPAANNAAAYGYQVTVDPAAYGVPPQQGPPSYFGNYLPPVVPRSHSPEEAPLQGPAQTYRRSSPSSQQQYPCATSGPMQQTYPNPPYGSAPASAGHGQTYLYNPPAAASSGYGHPVAGYGQQPGVQQQPQANPQAGYGLYPVPQPAVFAEQQQSAANNAAAYWYQAPVDPAAFGALPRRGPPATAYPVAAAFAAQPTQARFGYVAAAALVARYGGYGAQQQQR